MSNDTQQAAPFRFATRRNRIPLQDMQFVQAGAFQRIDVPQVGYAARLIISLFGTITTGASAVAGAFSNYFPYNILNSISFRSNEGLELYRTGGYGNMLVQTVMNAGFAPAQQTAPTAFNATASGMRTAVGAGPAPGTTLATSTVYNVLVTYMIPIAADDRLSAGLILLQNQATRAQLELQLNSLNGNGGVNGMLNAAGNLGVGGAISLTAKSSMEFFAVPYDEGSQPDTTFVHRWIEDQVSWTSSGDLQYKVPVNGIVSRIIVDVENNGAPLPWFVSASNPNSMNIGLLKTTYAASMTPEIEDPRIALWRNRWNYDQDLPDGVHVFEYSLGGGNTALGWDGRDTYDTALLTEFMQTINFAIAPTQGKIRFLRQELQRRAQ